MRAFALATSLALLAAGPAQSGPSRVVSTSLCGDGYVLTLADPDQIAGLSWQSDHALSRAPDWAKDLPKAHADIERLLALDPDLIVFGSGESFALAPFLDKAGIAYVELTWGEDFDSVKDNYRRIGAALDRADAADTAVTDLESRLRALSRRNSRPVEVLYLQRSGGSTGSGTFVNAALDAGGAVNIMADQAGWTGSDPEGFLRYSPEAYILSFMDSDYESANALPVTHSVYRARLDSAPVIEIDGANWPCAGPYLIEAAEDIAVKLEPYR